MAMNINVERRLGAVLDLARRQQRARSPEGPHYTIALSREAGTQGRTIARLVGERLGWAVYDRELLSLLAEQMGVQPALLENVDEKRVNWLLEFVENLSSPGSVSQSSYVRKLVETIVRLAAKGDCVLVGRGAAQILPPATTLRVRLIAPPPQRIAATQKQFQLTHSEAERWVQKTDHERTDFVSRHFHYDPTAPHGYDLILNSARYSAEGSAELIIEALHRLQTAQASPSSLPLSRREELAGQGGTENSGSKQTVRS